MKRIRTLGRSVRSRLSSLLVEGGRGEDFLCPRWAYLLCSHHWHWPVCSLIPARTILLQKLQDNRELEARLRQADAAAAEARAARAGADAERIRLERELQAAREKVRAGLRFAGVSSFMRCFACLLWLLLSSAQKHSGLRAVPGKWPRVRRWCV